MSSIDERIAELQQRIAEKQAFRRMYHPNRNMAIWDYVAEGDRSGFDRIDASETAYHNMLRQQEQQEKMLGLQQAQQEKMLGLQQDFTAKENELNRINAKELAKLNKSQQSEYNLSKAREILGNLAINRDTLAGQGKDTRMVDNQIQSLVERYPELQMPEAPRYDPTKSVDYKLAKYSQINSKSTNSEEIAEAMEELKKFNAPEAAKRLAELELEYDKRVKYEESDAYIKDLIKAFDVNTGDLDPALANRGYESKHATGGKFKLVKDGKVIKSYSGKKSQSWD